MDELARRDTPARRLDARAKIIATLAFVVAVMSFPRHAVAALTPFAFYPLALIALGRIPPGFILKKVLAASPFAVAVGLFNPILDRAPAATLGPLVITGGWVTFASILLRFALTVGAALALVACTGMNRLGAALERLGVPRVLVVQLLFLYRYLFVTSDQAARMARGAALRSGGRRPGLRVYGSMIGHLLLRSLDRAERIYRAMVARGFDGEIRVLEPSAFRRRDAAFVCGCLALFGSARAWNIAGAVGRLLTGGAS